ncbi:MAG: Transcriptional regulatory protein sin3 [Peltula sp. TS41687]|nr:MAG: Transcriptional regulatory protein sin3 [Peltula sp. TS41687]
MSANNPDGWPPSLGAPGPSNSADQHIQAHQRPLPGYGQSNVHPNAHSIAALTGMAQPLPQASQVHPASGMQPSASQSQSSAPSAPGYPLPGLGQAIQQPQGRPSIDRERDIRQMDLRERDMRERQRQQEEMAQREREQHERESRDRQHREPLPQQNHAGAITIHQPVASKVSTAIHAPGGLLSGIGSGPGPNPTGGLAHSTGSAGIFGPPLQAGDGPGRSLQALPPQNSQNPTFPFGVNHGIHPLSGGGPGLPHGQQPILNDALSYLDQVKVQFVDQPDVYNRFLDIMKDFKSQAIDTPGVIERVSNLFAGHPNLIQGFNTFLPPGYRIECGSGDDPNAIRVTTPMGTTVSSMSAAVRPPSTPANGALTANGPMNAIRHGPYYEQMPRNLNAGWQQQPPPITGAVEGVFGPNARPAPLAVYGPQSQGPSPMPLPENQNVREAQAAAAGAAAASRLQQEQRGVSQLQSAVSAATGTAPPRQQLLQGSPTGAPSQLVPQTSPAPNGAGGGASPAAQSGLEKRGPVEFNHAISYVNKIKNRFANQPDIYKQFLEILQTYQRESKPIQDVYAQVTHLFNSAPDLLEDFKQFLPESAAQAKAHAAAKQAAEDAVMLSNVRGEPVGLGATPTGPPSQQTPGPQRSEMKMPPVGNFAHPPSATKDTSKRRRGGPVPTAGVTSSSQVAMALADTASAPQALRMSAASGGSTNKRTKVNHAKAVQAEAMATASPTLTPALPEPLPPNVPSGATTEEIAFFDRVKKFIANKQTMNEFLKICNLFSQDLIDKGTLISRVSNFIGGNPELMTWFKRFVAHDGKDEVIENKPKPSNARVNLSNCRGYGPSYRLLPKRERIKVCSGRDEMCWNVLNSDWASHPTWASEDSGFVAHRKNQFEEALHRIEEERHDYDFNVEASQRTIQLLEPIAQTIARMSPDERANFTLPPGIGGQSTAIYHRVIRKLYGVKEGGQVIQCMTTRPCAIIPVVLARLKQKDEEWRATQREWEKVWREQTAKNYWKSLDHLGINAKTADKRNFATKTLVNEVHTRYEEQRRQRGLPGKLPSKYQLEYAFNDVGVILDACRLLIFFAASLTNTNGIDRQKLENVVKDFTTMFFDISAEKFEEAMSNIPTRPIDDEDMQDVMISGETSSTRGRAGANTKKNDLLRGVLDRSRNGKSVQNEADSSVAHGSKETTPDIISTVEDDVDDMTDAPPETTDAPDASEDTWVKHPLTGVLKSAKGPLRNIPRNEPYRREKYSLYCGTSIYCFFRMFQILYERLSHLKHNEKQVVEDVRRAKLTKPAADLSLLDKKPEAFFDRTDADANYYKQVLGMIQDVLDQRMEMTQFEELMRRFYLHCGWQLYSFDRLFNSLARLAINVMSNDTKDKSNDMIQLFYKNREKEDTTCLLEINYRKQVEKLVKDGDLYRIEFNQTTKKAGIQVLRKDDPTFSDNNLSPEAKWVYYITSYTKVEPTEGVPIEGHVLMPFLKRNLPEDVEEPEPKERSVPYLYQSDLEFHVCVNSYKIDYDRKGIDWFVHSKKQRMSGFNNKGLVDLDRASQHRRTKFREKFVLRNNKRTTTEAERDEMDRNTKSFRAWIDNGPPAQAPNSSASSSSAIINGDQRDQDRDWEMVDV